MRMLVNEEAARACGGADGLPTDLGKPLSPGTIPPTQVSPGGGLGYLHDRWKAMHARLGQAPAAG